MNEKNERRDERTLIRLLIVVLTLLAIVGALLLIISVTYSKYATRVTSGDSARVAQWTIDAEAGNSANVSLVKATTTGSYTLTVRSQSEVACTYAINLGNVPQGVSATIGGTTLTANTDNATLVFNNVGSFAASPSTTSASHTITFSAAMSTVAQTYTIPVSVTFTQID